MGEEEGSRRERAPKTRLSAEKRERFLEVLGQTGNRRLAAEAIGVEPRLMDQRREFDPLLDRQWKEAIEQSERRLSGASGPLDCIGGTEPMVIRRGPGGRARVVRAGAKRWSRPVEERFFAALAVSGNIAAAARSVGFTASTIAQRRRQWPAFAERMEETLEDAEIALEFRFATSTGGWGGLDDGDVGSAATMSSGSVEDAPATEHVAEAPKFDPDLAMRFLKWREQKKRGRDPSRGGLPPKRWTFDESIELLEKKLQAFGRRSKAEQLKEGWSEDEEGRMIPPGWVRGPDYKPGET